MATSEQKSSQHSLHVFTGELPDGSFWLLHGFEPQTALFRVMPRHWLSPNSQMLHTETDCLTELALEVPDTWAENVPRVGQKGAQEVTDDAIRR